MQQLRDTYPAYTQAHCIIGGTYEHALPLPQLIYYSIKKDPHNVRISLCLSDERSECELSTNFSSPVDFIIAIGSFISDSSKLTIDTKSICSCYVNTNFTRELSLRTISSVYCCESRTNLSIEVSILC